jgi:multidrug efflux pump subunit AcrA (membrane-fusion protein)
MVEKEALTPLRYLMPVCVLGIGLAAYWLMGSAETGSEKVIPKKELRQVFVQAAQMYDEPLIVEVDGAVVPFREIQLATQVAGRVAEKSERCRAGNFVSDQEPLFRIDSKDFDFEVARWEKQAEQSIIELEEVALEIQSNRDLLKIAEQDRELLLKELSRLKRLKDGQIITESDVDKSQRAVLTSQNTFVQLSKQLATYIKRQGRLESALDLARIELDQAKLNLQRTEVLTPISGVITQELVEEDSFVQKGAALVVIEDTSRAEVRCNLRMEELYWIWSHVKQVKPAELSAAVQSQLGAGGTGNPQQYQLPQVDVDVIYRIAGQPHVEYTWQGRLERYDGYGIDPDTRMIPVRVVVEKPRREGTSGPPRLLRGMYVTVRFKVRPRARLVHVPEGAIQAGNQLWTLESDPGSKGQARLKRIDEVSVIQQVNRDNNTGQERWVIDASTIDLQPGALVVAGPLLGAQQGDLVRYRQQDLVPPGISQDKAPREDSQPE